MSTKKGEGGDSPVRPVVRPDSILRAARKQKGPPAWVRWTLIVSGVFLGLAAVSAVVGQAVLEKQSNTPLSGDTTEKVFVLDRGDSLRAIGERLEREGLINSAMVFYIYGRFERKADRQLRVGEYGLSASMTPHEILERLVKGQVLSYKVTVPEGLTIREIAPLFAANGLFKPDEIIAVASNPEFASSLGIKAKTVEGYLYPDTYTLQRGMSAKDLVKTMVSMAELKLTNARRARGRELGLDPHQVLTLASIIEKETGAPEERPIISAVFHNRLRRGMRLQTDPTVIYAHYVATGEWLENIRRVHLEADHPYNTYTREGLPPGPIASPGEAAIDAALYPAQSDALFFVSKNDGTHVFCPTLECHEAAVQKWQVEFFRNKRAANP